MVSGAGTCTWSEVEAAGLCWPEADAADPGDCESRRSDSGVLGLLEAPLGGDSSPSAVADASCGADASRAPPSPSGTPGYRGSQ